LQAAMIEPLQQLSAELRAARGGGQDPYEAADQMLLEMKDDGRAVESDGAPPRPAVRARGTSSISCGPSS
jgi:hypothetical protein